MRLLGLDIGARKIGISVGEIIAYELSTLKAPKEITFYSPAGIKIVAKDLSELIKKESIEMIVVGLPVNEDGAPTEESNKISSLCDQLRLKLGVPFRFTNETLTSSMASQMLREQDIPSKEVSEREHQLAAQLILQQYIEENENI